MAFSVADGGRRKQKPAERREQRRRSETRTLTRLMAGLSSIDSHRGNLLSKVGKVLFDGLQVCIAASPRPPPPPPPSSPAPLAPPGALLDRLVREGKENLLSALGRLCDRGVPRLPPHPPPLASLRPPRPPATLPLPTANMHPQGIWHAAHAVCSLLSAKAKAVAAVLVVSLTNTCRTTTGSS